MRSLTTTSPGSTRSGVRGGIEVVSTSMGLVVRGNFSHHNGGPGLWTDIGNIYTLYENNTVEDNERGGIFHELSYDAIDPQQHRAPQRELTQLPFWTTGAGIEILDSPNVEVYGNTVEDNWQGITGLDDHRGSGPHGPYALKNLNVHDNIIVSRVTEPGGGRTGIIDMDLWTAFARATTGSSAINMCSAIRTASISSGSVNERWRSGSRSETTPSRR